LLGDLPAVQAEDLHRLESDLTPSRRHADEVALVRTPHSDPYGHVIVLSNELFGLYVEIRKGSQHSSDEFQLRCGSIHIRQVGVVPNVIRRQQVFNDIQILPVPRFNPAMNNGILLFHGHRKPPELGQPGRVPSLMVESVTSMIL
jgi:hypothetical protein